MDKIIKIIIIFMWIITCSFWLVFFPSLMKSYEIVNYKVIPLIQILTFVNNTIWTILYFIIEIVKKKSLKISTYGKEN